MSSLLYEDYPWVSRPLIANAAMAGFAGSKLAAAVTGAGGMGFIGSEGDIESLLAELDDAKTLLKDSQINTIGATLPIGVGFLVFLTKLEAAAVAIAKYRPAAILLACPPEPEMFAVWSHKMRAASPRSRIWIQIPSVTAAVDTARRCAPDVLVLQAADAGGHGGSPGAGIVSLIPEARDALDAAGFHHISVLGAGGIGDGRGVAATLAAGADGVLLGTAFLASQEVKMRVKEFQEAILAAYDGGRSTVRATVFDELRGKNIWPNGWDGRALANSSYRDYQDGVGIEEVRRRYADAAKSPHKGYGGEQRAAIWAGSGVGLVNEVKAAGDIVRELREGSKAALERAASSL